MNIQVPSGSIYFWMYSQGLKQVDLKQIEAACFSVGKDVRQKDVDNYWRGWYKADLYTTDNWNKIFKFHHWMNESSNNVFLKNSYNKYPQHPYHEDIKERWVPCNKNNKPMIKWGDGCMSRLDAESYPHQVYLAENMKGCNKIVIDCDGDHDDVLDMETISFLWQYSSMTHTLSKPKDIKEYKGYRNTGLEIPASFHLTFKVDRIIPTMHFPYAHVDIIGNRCNSLRYLKNKKWNGIEPALMTEDIWKQLQNYIGHRKE